MAKKGQSFRKYTEEEINNAVLWANEHGPSQAANKYGININTIATWQRKFSGKTMNYMYGQVGRPKLNDLETKYEILKKYQAFVKQQTKKK